MKDISGNEGGMRMDMTGLFLVMLGGRPMKLSPEEFTQLQELLSQKSTWTTDEVRTLIYEKFGVEYTLKQIRIILKKLKMKYGKPFIHDYRRPDDAESLLKKPA